MPTLHLRNSSITWLPTCGGNSAGDWSPISATQRLVDFVAEYGTVDTSECCVDDGLYDLRPDTSSTDDKWLVLDDSGDAIDVWFESHSADSEAVLTRALKVHPQAAAVQPWLCD